MQTASRTSPGGDFRHDWNPAEQYVLMHELEPYRKQVLADHEFVPGDDFASLPVWVAEAVDDM